MHCHIFCNLADSSRLLAFQKKIRKSLSSQPKIKPTTCGYSGPGSLEKPEKLIRLFSHKKKLKAQTTVAHRGHAGNKKSCCKLNKVAANKKQLQQIIKIVAANKKVAAN